MKKSELKATLKPLIKECIKEVIFEEGVLSGLIKEVAHGLAEPQVITEVDPPAQDFSRQRAEMHEEMKNTLNERKRTLEKSLGSSFDGVFSNMSPMDTPPSPGSGNSPQSPLAGHAPSDPGVDISGILALGSGENWKKMI